MGVPSSQVAAVWVKEELGSTTWVLLREVLFSALRKNLRTSSDPEVWDLVEANLDYVAEHLRDCVAEWVVNGSAARFEIDNDPSPYIRLVGAMPS